MNKKTKKEKISDLQNVAPKRVKMPTSNQRIGMVDKRLGGSRMHVRNNKRRDTFSKSPWKDEKVSVDKRRRYCFNRDLGI